MTRLSPDEATMLDHANGIARIVPLIDPVVDQLGHEPRSAYVEKYWLGILGPSTTWFLRHVALRLDESPDGFRFDADEVAGSLGLGTRRGRHSAFARTIERACQFGLARHDGDHVLAVRRHVPPLTLGQVRRLPDHLQLAHSDHLQDALRRGDDLHLQRARRLALALLEVGDSAEEAARHLSSWGVDHRSGEEAMAWAHGRHLRAREAAYGDDAA